MHSLRKGLRRPRSVVGLVSAGAVVSALLAGVPAATAAGSGSAERPQAVVAPGADPTRYAAGRYVVVMREPATASYAGGTDGLKATKAAPGRAFQESTKAAKSYAGHLRQTQRRIAREVGATVERSYTTATNGFVADLTAKQALDLATDRRVLTVAKDEARHLDTWNTPTFLGLDGRKGAWQKYAGGRERAGDGIVVADLDSGIWPETRSFRGKPLARAPRTKWDISMDGTATRMEKADGTVFRGECEAGEEWAKSFCTTKIVSARYYPETFLQVTPPEEIADSEFISARDGSGHGSHTAGTAVGNPVPNVKVEDRTFGEISGMAPAAKLAVYKVCWEDTDPDTGGCYNSAILAAIDDAVADGADVLNFSISGATDTVVDPVELAFEGAAEAGMFIAASAGNSGPGASTVAHNSPWLTTVAATTHTAFENTLVLGNGEEYVGASISSQAVPSTPLVTAESSVVAGGDAEDASLCGPDTLDPAKVAGTMVVCLRGGYDRTAKSAEVERAGGVAMVLANPAEGSLDADFHAVPTVHVSHEATPAIVAYAETPGATGAIVLGNQTGVETPVPQVGGFSSRGPATANDSDLLKPDIAAPGVSVLAAVAPPSNSDRRFDLYSGTSMAAPHISGLAAFMLGEHPQWGPMDVKSAMMTTASSVLDADGAESSDWFAQGAGQVRPTRFFDPGLFVTSTGRDWRGFITGQGLDTGVPALAAKDLNVPSLAQSAVTGTTEFTRTFRATRKGTWRIASAVPGFRVTTSPTVVRARRANDLVEVTFTMTRTDAALGEWTKGAITLSGPTEVRLPVALKPVAVAAPDVVAGEGIDGSVQVPITAGFTGELDVTAEGLTKAVSSPGDVPEGDYALECVTVAADTDSARFELDSTDDTADLDMYVYTSGSCDPATVTAVAGEAATPAADETLTLEAPAPGTYLVEVDGYAAGSAGSPIDYTLDYFGIGATSGVGDLTVTPDPVPVQLGRTTSFTLGWTGLEPASTYLGRLTYAGSDEPTYVEVATP